MKPKILLSVNAKKENYINAVNNCGGIAYAEYCPKFSAEYDGLLLGGGNDINPELYNEPINGAVDIDHERDKAEVELFRAFVNAGKPIMGICRGHQLINVLLGGSLYQDIEYADIHKSKTDVDNVHEVNAVAGSIFDDIYGKSFPVNSVHHQAVKRLGEGLDATLHADNGIIEGFEHKTLPIMGVQFHPERICFTESENNTVDGSEIIKYFINLCKKDAVK